MVQRYSFICKYTKKSCKNALFSKKFGHAGYALAFNDTLVPSMSPPIKMGPTSKLRSLNAAYTQFFNLKNTKKHIFCIFPLKNLRI